MMIRTSRPLVLKRAFFGSSKPQSYSISRVLNGSPEQVFDIVSRVDNYKNFVPFVEDSFITSRDGGNLPSGAGLKIGWNDITERFVCKLHCEENRNVYAKSVELELFETLETQWVFSHVSTSKFPKCRVDFKLTYKFRNPLYNHLSSMFAPQVSNIMIGAFEKQLKQQQR
ncbi:uncharacterized protein LODBEIA_P57560 [Lodderomyces beijingensis]|uniref:Coenzyme Q-binding protein COQ10 START domain-containing protein n=1 Tax=Lodderomyces beijingensis TaxID=1775926 RepID=A0ABP0ZGG7_9ASCO